MRQRAVRLAVLGAAIGAAAVTAAQSSGHHLAAGASADPLAGVELVGFYHAPRRLQAAQRVRAVRPAARPAKREGALEAAPTPTTPTQATQATQTTSTASPSPDSSLRFEWPAQGSITTPFIPSGPLRHDGIDIGNLRSLTVIAAHAGQVIHVGYTTGFEGYGNIVDVEVAPGVETLYAHLSAMDVQIGDEVQEGETIATAGCTGICYGTHLHFEVRENGTPVNPLNFLP
jgi:murein DD-endopeptidase MepM/ murein hydrolase activator NlpD